MFLSDQTVIVDKGLIAAVFPSKETKVPAGAQIIDGRGKTLIPGLWDCHMHVATTTRVCRSCRWASRRCATPATTTRRPSIGASARRAASCCIPHVYASSLIDGKGKYTAQVANVATSEAEAIALVDKAKANGFIGVKFYGTLEQGLAAGSGRGGSQTGSARARTHPRRHAAAGCDQRRL